MSTCNAVSSNNKLSYLSDQQKKSLLLLKDHSDCSEIYNSFEVEHFQITEQVGVDNLATTIKSCSPDLVIYDIGNASAEKLSNLTHIRSFYQGALMVIASASSEQNHVLAFNLGTDEYLVKPISHNIMLCRAKALLKRCEQNYIAAPDKLSVGDIALFPQSQKCEVRNTEVQLTFFEFKLLMLLAENAGKVMSREFIYSSLLRRDYNGIERTVDVRMSQLRDKLSNQGVKNGAIETVWGQGYMFSVAA